MVTDSLKKQNLDIQNINDVMTSALNEVTTASRTCAKLVEDNDKMMEDIKSYKEVVNQEMTRQMSSFCDKFQEF